MGFDRAGGFRDRNELRNTGLESMDVTLVTNLFRFAAIVACIPLSLNLFYC